MQATQAGDIGVRRIGVEEALKTPSLFRGVKKFLISRNDCQESSNLVNHKEAAVTEPQPAPVKSPVKDTKPVVVPSKVAIQPPLPPYPPPDSPPNLNIKIKQEKEDDYEPNTKSTVPVPAQETTSKPVNSKDSKKTICKEFIRGNCKRTVCRYAHEVDISQLEGIFTFCWNYQNGGCTYRNCRYVHATIFEEQEFYRSGVLPEHVKNYMKQQTPPQEVAPKEVNHRTQPPPHFHPGLKYHKEMVENAKQSSEELNRKMQQLNRKSSKLFNVLLTLLRPMASNNSNNGLIINDNEKTMLEQLNDLVGTNSRTFINDDNIKSIMGANNNLSTLMTKLLCGAGGQALIADSSRET